MNVLPSVRIWDQVRPIIRQAEKAHVALKAAERVHMKSGKSLEERRSRTQRVLRTAEAAWLLTDPVVTDYTSGIDGSEVRLAHVLMVHTCDFIEEGKGKWSKARAEAAVIYMQEGSIPRSVLAVFPQGYQKKNPTVPHGKHHPLGKNVGNYYAVCRSAYLGEKYEDFATSILCVPLGWGTLHDILNAYEMVRKRGYEYARFYMVSDRTHLKRIKLVWDKTHPEGWLAEFLPTPEPSLGVLDRVVRERVVRLAYRLKLWKMRFFRKAP